MRNLLSHQLNLWIRFVEYSDKYNCTYGQLIEINIEKILLILFVIIVKRLWEYKTPIRGKTTSFLSINKLCELIVYPHKIKNKNKDIF